MVQAEDILDKMNLLGKKIVRFHTPHPGFAGAAIPFPPKLKAIADSLDGKMGTVEDAMDLFIATDGEDMDVRVEARPNQAPMINVDYIRVYIFDGTCSHSFRAICYDDFIK